ncbi:MAG: phosphatidylinositol-3,5-bisphosphate 5-phosphatase [Watsoniomyces obsoletus]|nr:MAG: phosphatidylinositol-3,5-bisphosphate 5-phosphatase [Watsoniomyces obsoletus]
MSTSPRGPGRGNDETSRDGGPASQQLSAPMEMTVLDPPRPVYSTTVNAGEGASAGIPDDPRAGTSSFSPAPTTSPAQVNMASNQVPLSSEAAMAATSSSPTVPTSVNITLLMISGARQAYRIDDKFMKRHQIHPPGNDVLEISVYTLKELILRDWQDEWESKPSSPSSIRLIHFGRLLDDKAPLRDCRFNINEPNVVHMTIRPHDLIDDEDGKTSKQVFGRDGHRRGDRSPGCRCMIL